ncbi:glycosyltransferase family 4 protein [Oceanobacillus sojae]|uniref:glycosyltransferase n=1 Tax=Oceanobacillus sojae TaxID=582851 RepID=UPI0021A68E3A|nr:glycosyltransferase family 4 protein [Oceanobacillus sojae]MCT1901855.1 glycosyltransferase family 4 protein [Oceanobacillus sojae]
MSGLFVHDHKFPKDSNGCYYYSYGFDKEFFGRYINIFNDLSVIGREVECNEATEEKVEKDIDFLTIKNLKSLKRKFIRKLIDNKILEADYVVIRLPSILGMYVARRAEKLKKPYLIEVVGCYWDGIIYKGKTKLPQAAIITYLMKKTIKKANYVVYVTENFLQKRYPTNGKTINCSNVTLKDVRDEDITKRLNLIDDNKNNKKILGTCATIDVIYKGQADVLKAISILKKEGIMVEYQLVGGGSTTYLKQIAEQLGVLDQINFIGTLKHDEVFKWLEEIDLYVHPSKQEGLSRAIIEAMSKGCPIFGADAGGIHEQIDEEFIFEKGNIESIISIFKEFSIETMKNQAIRNHNESRKYIKSTLYKKRNDFFNKFILENK